MITKKQIDQVKRAYNGMGDAAREVMVLAGCPPILECAVTIDEKIFINAIVHDIAHWIRERKSMGILFYNDAGGVMDQQKAWNNLPIRLDSPDDDYDAAADYFKSIAYFFEAEYPTYEVAPD